MVGPQRNLPSAMKIRVMMRTMSGIFREEGRKRRVEFQYRRLALLILVMWRRQLAVRKMRVEVGRVGDLELRSERSIYRNNGHSRLVRACRIIMV